MERGIFGSTCSLGGLMNEEFFSEGDADQFLQEMGGSISKGLDAFANTLTSSGAAPELPFTSETGMAVDASVVSPVSCPPASAALSPALPATLSTQAWAASGDQQMANSAQPAGNLAVLSQLLSALQSAQQPALQPQQPTSGNLIAQIAAAFKPTAPPTQSFAPVSQATASAPLPLPVTGPTLPSMNAQQQQALQTIISLGQLGNTAEGKKVRRMLSNRESARRSRHRKQAHVVELEEKASKLEEENLAMRAALERAARLETEGIQERARLHAELTTLRSKLESSQAKAGESNIKQELPKGGSSRNSSAGHNSDDSCCDSLSAPSTVDAQEPCCKRCRVAEA